MLTVSRRRRTVDIWPGFVDALAALLMVVIFILLIFSLGEFLLTDALVGRDEALDRLRLRASELADMLAMERTEVTDLEKRVALLGGQLQSSIRARDELSNRLNSMTLQAQTSAAETNRVRGELEETRRLVAANEASIAQQRSAVESLEADRQRLTARLQASQQAVIEQEALSEEAQATVDELTTQMVALREQLQQLNQALEASEAKVTSQTVEIEDLGNRLNVALANRVQELARYRSEFFGKLRETLKENPDIRIEGDRFVLPSEVLFASASADLDQQGRQQIDSISTTLKELSEKIPKEIDWVLRVDGHTDRRAIRKAFKSNWELSSARAISIVKYMIEAGIPPDRLVAAGFGQFHPLDTGSSAEAYRRNRRIELKLTSR